jgi:hypothetical protein
LMRWTNTKTERLFDATIADHRPAKLDLNLGAPCLVSLPTLPAKRQRGHQRRVNPDRVDALDVRRALSPLRPGRPVLHQETFALLQPYSPS